jgi:hypothetical protein
MDTYCTQNRGSSVGVATGYELDGRRVGIRVPVLKKKINFSISSRPALEHMYLPIQWVPKALSPGVKQQGPEAHHSPPSSVKIKKTSIHPLPHTSSWRSA